MKPDFSFYNFDVLSSTNDKAREFAKERKANLVVVAKKQEKGRGRFGRKWSSSPGGLYMTIILKEKGLDKAKYLTFIAAVSVAKAIRKIAGLDAKVKWPNDILINHKKVCGILTENVCTNVNYALVGIGLNVNQKKFPRSIMRNSTSIMIESNSNYDIEKIAKTIINEFNRLYDYYNKKNYKKIVDIWKEYSHTLGKMTKAKTLSGNYTGKAVDVDEECNLILKLNDGSIKKIVEADIFVI
ncbi:biotin--[acetyl-CoA-carboxylase] ligase [Candidatus Woesearchaeota archaeon]|nr:biotin--[acetyl-CoA-carboxylase] ligase [Candidatus Woesearchaeota archaeon]